MTVQLRPGHSAPPNITGLLAGLDALADLGVRTDHPKLKPARRAAERVRELRQQNTAVRARGADQELQRVAHAYASGEIVAEQLPENVVRIDAMDTRTNKTLHRVLDQAEAVASGVGIKVCRDELGDRWITEILRPAVDNIVAALTPELIERAEHAVHLLRHDLDHQRASRDALERLRDLLAQLDKIHDLAVSLMNCGIVPMARRRESWHREDIRWLHHDRLDGSSTVIYEPFFLQAVRNGAEPGLWTADELVKVNPSLVASKPARTTTGARTAKRGGRVVA